MADWRVDVLKGLGAPLSKQNMNFLATWQRWEGGHTNNDARWNWLNTTSNAPGAIRSINSVGVKAFDNYHDGINATIQTLNNGRYPDVVEALRKGDPYAHKPVAGLSTWLSGQPASKSGLAYASRVLGGPVQNPAPVTQGPKVPKASGQGNASVRAGGQTYGGGRVSPQRLLASSDADSMYQQALSGFLLGRASARLRGENPTGGLLELVQLRDQYQAMGGVPDAPEARTTAHRAISKAQPPMNAVKNGQIIGPQAGKDIWKGNELIPEVETGKGTHVTDNLDWNNGRKTARDIMAAPGTVVGAPEAGTVVRHGSAQGGQSLYFQGVSGRMYWLGHIDNILPEGARVTAGKPIARISADHPRPHLHFDYKL